MAKPKVPRAATTGLDAAKLYEAINCERKLRELTLEEVAAELDVSSATMLVWQHGGGMRADVLMRIAVWLQCDLRSFVKLPAGQPATQEVA